MLNEEWRRFELADHRRRRAHARRPPHHCAAWGYGEGIQGVPRREEAVEYRLSPLAARQWEVAMDWADRHGRIEVALHAVGAPRDRQVLRFDCGPQWVSGSSCHNEPEGVFDIGRRATADGLSLMGQVHHHPFYYTSRGGGDRPSYFLSHTDWRLLEQLAGELAAATVVFREEFSGRRDAVLRVTDHSHLEANGARYALPFPAGTVLNVAGAQWRELAGCAEAFVAVTGSDRALPHGYVLRGEVCTHCGLLARRRIHPLEFTVCEDCEPQFGAQAFEPRLWKDLLRRTVRRGYYYRDYSSTALRRLGVDADNHAVQRHDLEESGLGETLSANQLRDHVDDRLHVLEKLLPPEGPEAGVVAELRAVFDHWLKETPS